MREVKFRGMDIVNNKWLYGNLEIPLINQSKSKYFIIGYYYGQYQKLEVNPKTVGQYTGLKDKNGKEIYEGDICETVTYSGKPFGTIDVVKFGGGAFKLTDIEDALLPIPLDDSDIQSVEVIGNIFEHKHLLEDKKCEVKDIIK